MQIRTGFDWHTRRRGLLLYIAGMSATFEVGGAVGGGIDYFLMGVLVLGKNYKNVKKI